jgi:hypothetical protein
MFPSTSLEAGEQISDRDPETSQNKDLTFDQIVLQSFVQLLPIPCFTRPIWAGLVTSMGGMSVSVVSGLLFISSCNFSIA